jgi:DNA-binding PadR family transcriptional regulator
VLNGRDWLLLFVGLPNSGYETDQIRLMKGMFLFTKEGPPEVRQIYHFVPYVYGPFDKAIYEDLDGLEARGLIASESESATNRRYFRLTPRGKQLADAVLLEAPKAAVDQLRQIKATVTSLSFLRLLRRVYGRYPEFAIRSRIR